ncbi:glucose 1-dehydrogenase [Bernardetia sp.]|uniref:glucose 1-dehydrogenase n=1 Tax=Bernardetia sp. TaxID=1937974 RepID=UPI0025B7B8A0|nr:glucose 1-dehydrogenase [Bernardetia sp.]
MSRFQGKVCIVTGGGSGIGLAAARLFLAEGAKVMITGRTQEKLDTACQELASDNVRGIKSDISVSEDRKLLVAETVKAFGKIDILYINSGIAKAAPIEQMTEEMYDEVLAINLKGPYFLIQAALPQMNDGGSIIFTGSISNQIGQHSLSAYAASKAGLRSLARTLSTELLPRNIRINMVSPGVTKTPILDMPGLSAEQVQEMIQSLASQNPMKRIAQPEEIAKAALFLASNDASYMLGTEIIADGGFTQLQLT